MENILNTKNFDFGLPLVDDEYFNNVVSFILDDDNHTGDFIKYYKTIQVLYPEGIKKIQEQNREYYNSENFKYDILDKKQNILKILKSSLPEDNNFINKMKKIFPNGINGNYICTDKEFALFKKEFNINIKEKSDYFFKDILGKDWFTI